MCGRFCIAASPGEIYERYKVIVPPEYKPRFNVAPGQRILTITTSAGLATWGFYVRTNKRIFNARIENVHEKPLFRNLYADHRCLIPASGYYEWKQEGSYKIPYYFSSTSENLFSIAGFIRQSKDGNEVVILTTKAPAPLDSIHARMPVILKYDEEKKFLTGKEFSSEMNLQIHEVSSCVNQVIIDEPDLIKPVKKRYVQQALCD